MTSPLERIEFVSQGPTVSLFVWVLSFDLSDKGGPTSSYATAGIALRIIAPRKPPYPAKDAFVTVEIPQGGIFKGRMFK